MKKPAIARDAIPPGPVAPKPATKPAALTVGAAKGRPMLPWIGKKPLRQVTAFPALLYRFQLEAAP